VKLQAIRIRRNPWLTALSAAPFALIPVLVALSLVTGAPWIVGIPYLFVLGLVTFFRAWQTKPRAIHDAVDVEVEGGELRIDRLRVPRGRVARAELLPRRPNAIVRVGLRRRPDEELVLDDDDAARDLLRALGFDASQTTATYRLRSLALVRYRWAPLLLIPLIMLATALHVPAAALVLPVTLLLILPLFLVTGKLVVGVDGVLVRWLWIREFIASRDIVRVGQFDLGSRRNNVRGVELTTAKRTIRLPVSSAWQGTDDTTVIARRIEDARALAASAAHVGDDALLFSRGDAPMRDWIGRLRALGAGATATLRTAAVPPEHLWRVADDPSQPAMKRAAAAVALAPSLDATGRVRLAEIARATAAPKLRVALERAAEDAPDDSLEAALQEIERE